jgi:hypothetical protein
MNTKWDGSVKKKVVACLGFDPTMRNCRKECQLMQEPVWPTLDPNCYLVSLYLSNVSELFCAFSTRKEETKQMWRHIKTHLNHERHLSRIFATMSFSQCSIEVQCPLSCLYEFFVVFKMNTCICYELWCYIVRKKWHVTGLFIHNVSSWVKAYIIAQQYDQVNSVASEVPTAHFLNKLIEHNRNKNASEDMFDLACPIYRNRRPYPWYHSYVKIQGYSKWISGVLTTCHTQYTADSSICIFLFNSTKLPVFVTYLTGALYVHRLWFYRHQHDNLYIYRVIRNDCEGFNNLSYTIHFR